MQAGERSVNSPGRRVLHIYDKLTVDGSTIHGGARLLMWVLPRLVGRGYEASLACLRARDQAGKYLESAGVTVHYLGRHSMDPRIIGELMRLIRASGVDILHTHGYASTTWGRLAARLANIPVVVHEHFIDDRLPWYQSLVDRVLSSSTTVAIGVSRAVADFMRQQRHLPASRLLVLTGGIPLAQFHRSPAAAVAELRRSLGIAPTAAVVGTVGRLAPVKGHSVLIRAWPAVLAAVPDAVLVLVGDGPERQRLERLAEELHVREAVVFTGYRDDISLLLSLFDVFTLPSFSEGVGLALIEAMAVRVAVVASEVGGMMDILSHESNSLLVPPGGVEPLSTAIVRLLQEKTLAARLAEAAQRTVARLDVTPYVAALAALYDALSSESPARARRRDWRGFAGADGGGFSVNRPLDAGHRA